MSLKLCVIGDSWGTNNPDYWSYGFVDKSLKQKGHEVFNISHAGASNFGQLLVLDYQVLQQNKTNFDYIIWFHSEPARDFTEFISLDYGEEIDDSLGQTHFPELTFQDFFKDLEYINNQNYEYAQKLYNQYHIPFLVIGGAGKLNDSIKNFDFVHGQIPCWFQEILELYDNLSIPKNCYHHHVSLMCQGRSYNRQEVLQEIELLDKLEDIMKNNQIIFPDSLHPAENLYTPMFDLLLNNIVTK